MLKFIVFLFALLLSFVMGSQAHAQTITKTEVGGFAYISIYCGTGNDEINFYGGSDDQVKIYQGTSLLELYDTTGLTVAVECYLNSGNDTFYYAWGTTPSANHPIFYVSGANGSDTIHTGNAPDQVLGGSDEDFIYTYGGVDDINGGDDDDDIFSGSNSDFVDGAGGAGDYLNQGGSADLSVSNVETITNPTP